MTKTAAAELAGNNIRVNSIHPGFIDTVMLEENDPSVNKEGQETTPLKRLGTPGEITDLVVFLASDQSSYITGAEVAIDRKSTRLNSSHVAISYAVFRLTKQYTSTR